MKKFLVFCLSSVLFLTVGIVSSVAQNNGAATIVESRQQILKYNIHVQDNNDEPIIGATVRIEGTSKGTITDKNGNATDRADPRFYRPKMYDGVIDVEMYAKELIC